MASVYEREFEFSHGDFEHIRDLVGDRTGIVCPITRLIWSMVACRDGYGNWVFKSLLSIFHD